MKGNGSLEIPCMMDKRAAILKPSPFKMGCLIILASCMLFYSFGKTKPDLLASMDNQVTSAMFRWRGSAEATGKVVIVDIDEKSLKRNGQWPWPRDVVARLVRSVHESGAKVIGFDIVFAEKDRTSIAEYVDDFSKLIPDAKVGKELDRIRHREDLNHDIELGRAVSEAPVVLGYVFQLEDDGLKDENETPFPSATIKISPSGISHDELSLISGYRAVLNIEDVAQARTEGFLNVFPDSSGMVRKVPLFMSLKNIPYPSLALEMVRTASREQEIVIHASSRKSGGKNGVIGVSVGDAFIPTDDKGQVMVNFRGPVKTFEYISASDVIDGLHADRIKDKYVLIGTSASGLLDFHATPFSGIFPGVEIQATIIDNVLTGSLLTYDIFTEIGLTYSFIFAGGILLSALLAYTGAVTGGLAGLLFIGCMITGDYYLFFLKGKLLGITYPLATIITVFLMVTLFNYFFELRKKQFIQTAFNRYVSPVVVNELMKRPERLTLSGEEKELTILFSDIRDFTSISEGMDPKRLGAFMNSYLTAMSGIIMENYGMVDKYIGDAIVAIWGAPLDDKDHARHGVLAALRMKRTLKTLQQKWQQQGLPAVDIGIGINTGLTSIGNFGSESRFEYTVLGDTVNIASRLEGLNKIYGTSIIISRFTRDVLNGAFFCRKIDTVQVKGKSVSIEIFEPLVEGLPDPEMRQEVEFFEKALDLYQKRDFVHARQMIGDLHGKNPCRLYELYLKRIGSYLTCPPPPDWQGVQTFETK